MIEETPPNTPNNNNLFFQKLVDSGFFPQYPEILNGSVINSGNVPKQEEPILQGSETQQQSGVSASELKPSETETQQSSVAVDSADRLETPETQQQSGVSASELKPSETETQQQSGVSASELKPSETETQQSSIVVNSVNQLETSVTQQQASVSIKELEVTDNQQQNVPQFQQPLQLEQTRSLSTSENNIKDLDKKSKENVSKQEFGTAKGAKDLSSEESENEKTPTSETTMNRSTTNTSPIEKDYTDGVLIPKYKELPNWRKLSG